MTINSIFYGRVRVIHFVGIGGIGMSGIAEIMISSGLEVHGSDLNENDSIRNLRARGATIQLGHQAQHVLDADVLVTSSAIRPDNPEVLAAHLRKIPVISRAQMLAELMRLQYGIAIAGSHGKTTTTSLVATMLQHAQLDPTVIIGGKVNQLDSNAMLGQGPFLVAEADESDGSFLLLSPSIAVITNIDPEHLDYWKGGINQLKQEFTNFANKLPFFGLCVACTDAEHVRAILPGINRRFVTYAIENSADYTAVDIIHAGLNTHFSVLKYGNLLGKIHLHLVGRHNVQNALAAIAVGDELGIPFAAMAQTLADFQGVQRRFTLVDQVKGITIIDDYGHHPVEVDAVLQAAKVTFPSRRIVVLFQPHRYTRTLHLFHEFKNAFSSADIAILSDIYSAGENIIDGISSEKLATACQQEGFPQVQYGGSLENATNTLAQLLKTGDVIITLGAGSITQSASRLVEIIQHSARI
jgi:UDP-N-acetylmuramate--alanine ligase